MDVTHKSASADPRKTQRLVVGALSGLFQTAQVIARTPLQQSARKRSCSHEGAHELTDRLPRQAYLSEALPRETADHCAGVAGASQCSSTC